MQPTLNIVGCGKLGRSLARLWHTQQRVSIGAIINRSLASASSAASFIGSGTPVDVLEQAPAADLWLIATPDGDIAGTAERLAALNILDDSSVLFHCSGALGSDVLRVNSRNPIASIHPVHSFARPEHSIASFSGTYCACEGDATALQLLKPLFTAVGANLFDIDSRAKSIYHAASVLACNGLVGLLDASLKCFAQAGVDSVQAKALLLPIVHQTVDNTLQTSPAQALTGPVSRGDMQTVSRQQQALHLLDPDILKIYDSLGQQTLKIAHQQGLDPDKTKAIQQLFDQSPL